jgi:hypothetical protein
MTLLPLALRKATRPAPAVATSLLALVRKASSWGMVSGPSRISSARTIETVLLVLPRA